MGYVWVWGWNGGGRKAVKAEEKSWGVEGAWRRAGKKEL